MSLATRKQEIAVGIIKKMKQIQNIAVGAFWTADGRPAGRPASHMAKEPLAPVDRPIDRRIFLKQNNELSVDRPGRPTKPESKGHAVGRPQGLSIDRPLDWQTCTDVHAKDHKARSTGLLTDLA